MGGATQELSQKVGQRYGWSIVFDTNDDGYWYVDVVVGLHDKRHFVSQDCSPPTKDGIKQGKAAAATVALDGLRTLIEHQEAKPAMELSQVFTTEIPIYESNDETWKRFWNDPPTVVGVDTEGNQISPPVLAQIATENYVILEIPRQGKLSDNLLRLLADESIVKVFCDNFSHHDKKSLGLLPIPENLTCGPIVDLESMAQIALGPSTVARGLSRIVSLVMPELNVRVEKPARKNAKARFVNIGRYTLIEQGKAAPLRSIAELSKKEQRYAALDAWCTLQAFGRLQEALVAAA